MSDHYAVTYVRAAAEHRCGECRGPIAKGDRYAHHVSITSDGVVRHRLCLGCQAWAEALEQANRALGRWRLGHGEDNAPWMWGALWTCIAEFWRECLSPEAVAFRKVVEEQEAKYKRELRPRVAELGAEGRR